MARVTINKVNERINQYGIEIVKGKGYYYFARMDDAAPNLNEAGLYGSPNLNAWTVDEIEGILLDRIEKALPIYEAGENPFIFNKAVDNK